ncbi:MAG: hypothetical protein EZS28_007412 [Streblomastix strix]|uniref:Uncharacterized protein n=1 Tax=Streblomastix strix TaxID=222440 RepID=A0A5J4WQM9_9EUKA|nr:MAG: hypothetical protein EZS28_007412 [Streblomastix strix]
MLQEKSAGLCNENWEYLHPKVVFFRSEDLHLISFSIFLKVKKPKIMGSFILLDLSEFLLLFHLIIPPITLLYGLTILFNSIGKDIETLGISGSCSSCQCLKTYISICHPEAKLTLSTALFLVTGKFGARNSNGALTFDELDFQNQKTSVKFRGAPIFQEATDQYYSVHTSGKRPPLPIRCTVHDTFWLFSLAAGGSCIYDTNHSFDEVIGPSSS